MNILELKNILQSYCYMGRSLDEVEVYDKDGNFLCALDSVNITTDNDREVAKITVHHMNKEIVNNETE